MRAVSVEMSSRRRSIGTVFHNAFYEIKHIANLKRFADSSENPIFRKIFLSVYPLRTEVWVLRHRRRAIESDT